MHIHRTLLREQVYDKMTRDDLLQYLRAMSKDQLAVGKNVNDLFNKFVDDCIQLKWFSKPKHAWDFVFKTLKPQKEGAKVEFRIKIRIKQIKTIRILMDNYLQVLKIQNN